ncbi:MAG: trigger factor [Candidatus Omnitrophica bacterium]|nr:trigger factor [Candidatus Omnitrophota bacterium]
MNVEVKKIDKLKRDISVLIEGDDFFSKKKESFLKNGKALKVPGFRPGSAPIEILEKHHGATLMDKFLNEVVPTYYEQALEQQSLDPASMPRIYDVDVTDKGLTFKAEFEIRPEVELSDDDYKKIVIKDETIKVDAIEVEKVITHLKENVKKTIDRDLEDDSLAQWAGYADVAKFKVAIEAELMVEKIRVRRQKIDAQIAKHLLKKVKVDVPKSEIERQQKEIVSREIYNLQMRGVNQQEIEKYKKEIEDKAKPLAEEQIKISYIINQIAKKENISLENNNAGEVVLGLILSQADYQG